MTFDSAQSTTISPIDKATTPYAFVFTNPTQVSSFLSNLSQQNLTSTDATISFSVPITQIDCNAESGKYLNHFRIKDASGITYDRSFTIIYEAPIGSQPQCNSGTITIE